jgi:hypothetical protein
LHLRQDELSYDSSKLEDLLLGVPAREKLAHLALHVDGHLGRRVGDGHALAHGAAQQLADFVRAFEERVAADGRAFRRANELRRIRHFQRPVGLLRLRNNDPGDEQQERRNQKDVAFHCFITF